MREGLIRMYTVVATASNRTAVVLYISEVKSEGSIRGDHIREGGLFKYIQSVLLRINPPFFYLFWRSKVRVLFEGTIFERGLIRIYTVGTSSNKPPGFLFILEVKSGGSNRGGLIYSNIYKKYCLD